MTPFAAPQEGCILWARVLLIGVNNALQVYNDVIVYKTMASRHVHGPVFNIGSFRTLFMSHFTRNERFVLRRFHRLIANVLETK